MPPYRSHRRSIIAQSGGEKTCQAGLVPEAQAILAFATERSQEATARLRWPAILAIAFGALRALDLR